MRLIDADALVRAIDALDMQIFDAPTIDAVIVVRCKDCKWYQQDQIFGKGYCGGEERYPGDYCSKGERK